MRKPSLLSLIVAVIGFSVMGYGLMSGKGILYFVFGAFLLFAAANIQSKEQTRKERAKLKENISHAEKKIWHDQFPPVDHRGIKKRNQVQNLILTGSYLIYEGINPQMTIESMEVHDEVLFARPDPKGHPTAVMVTDYKGETAGWIPEKFNGVQEVANSLACGATVLGRVSSIDEDEKKRLNVKIDIAWYEPPQI